MFSKKYYLKIFAEKPEIFGSIPEKMLSNEQFNEITGIPRLAVMEMSPGVSLEALLHTVLTNKPDAVLPTISYTGTEYGTWEHYECLLRTIKKKLEKENRIYVAHPVIMGAPDLWWALNGRFASQLQKRFNFFTQCFCCRLYSFALRIPLCKKINAHTIFSAFQPRITSETMDDDTYITAQKYYRMFLSSFGISLNYSMYDTTMQKVVNNTDAVCTHAPERHEIRCVFRNNLCNMDGFYDKPDNLSTFFESYAIPAAAKIISGTLAGKRVDYEREVRNTLLPVAGPKKKKRKKKV